MNVQHKFVAIYKNNKNFIIDTKFEKKILRRSVFIDNNENVKITKNKKIKKLNCLKNKSCDLIIEDTIIKIKFEKDLGYIKIESQSDGIVIIVKTSKIKLNDKILKI